MTTDWRRALADLGRGAPKVHPPLLAPMLFTAAAEIEALESKTFAADPTKLVKGISELTRMSGLDAAFVAVPCGGVAAAFGADLDTTAWPPKVVRPPPAPPVVEDFADAWARSPFLSASLEAARRLAGAGSIPAVLAAFEGPALLARQLFADPDADDVGDVLGRVTAALVREFALAGASALVLIDDGASPHRAAALRTAGNVARFQKVPLFTVVNDGEAAVGPPTAIPCLAAGLMRPAGRPYGTVLPAAPGEWDAAAHDEPGRLITTAGEVSGFADIGALTAAVRRLADRMPRH